MIGSLGKIAFVATPTTIRTLTDFSRTSSGRWAKHDIIGRKPLTQRIGPGLDTISFAMRFDARFGLNPRKEMDALIVLERDGTAMALTLGGKGIGSGLWVITSLEQAWTTIDKNGNLVVGTVNISLEEYVVTKK